MWPVWLICTVAGVVGSCVVVTTFAITFAFQQRKLNEYVKQQQWHNNPIGKLHGTSPIMLEAQHSPRIHTPHRFWRVFTSHARLKTLSRTKATHTRSESLAFGLDTEISLPLLVRDNHLIRLPRLLSRRSNNSSYETERLNSYRLRSLDSADTELKVDARRSPATNLNLLQDGSYRSSDIRDGANPSSLSAVVPELRPDSEMHVADNPLNAGQAFGAQHNTVGHHDAQWPLASVAFDHIDHSHELERETIFSANRHAQPAITESQSFDRQVKNRPWNKVPRPISLAATELVQSLSTDTLETSRIARALNSRFDRDQQRHSLTADQATKRWSDQSVGKRVNCGFTGPPGRHSMYVWSTNEKQETPCPIPNQKRNTVYSLYPPPTKRDHGVAQRRQSVSLPVEGCEEGRVKGHRRQNCVRISGIPAQPDSRRFSNNARGSIRSPGISRLSSKASNQNFGLTASQSTRGDARHASNGSDPRRSWGLDIFVDNGPYTPQRGLTTHQEEDEEDEESLMLKPTMPETHHNSPILPSPAYTPAGLFPYKSRVQGPRSLKGRSYSPIRRIPSTVTKSALDLRKSIMLLRCMNSEDLMLDAEQEQLYRNLGGSRGSVRSSKHSLDGIYALRTHTPSPLSSRPITPTKDMSMSRSVISVWEDTSVHDESDSTESQLPLAFDGEKSTSAKCTSTILTNNANLDKDIENQPAGNTPVRKRYEPTTIETPRTKSTVLPRLWETPGSLYDQDGFLKEGF